MPRCTVTCEQPSGQGEYLQDQTSQVGEKFTSKYRALVAERQGNGAWSTPCLPAGKMSKWPGLDIRS